ncbi:hypothetical protein EV421DRAFT_1917316 [Armillaria borealis]|uniref:Uncharacterized protein n=1 Tax=Armillaria borealis TaxID=47425 RepID=A0AA39IE07_9AGAR|nr:hypothetical protein EV421DRAFT_1917316 [Armillaria borealis]
MFWLTHGIDLRTIKSSRRTAPVASIEGFPARSDEQVFNFSWKSARRNIGGLPEPLHGLSEPAWANLVFVPICHFCYKMSAKSPELLFGARICTACPYSYTLSIADLQRVPECIRTNGGTLLVATLIPISPLKRTGKRCPEESCLVRDYEEICQAWLACNTEHERNTLIQSRSGSMAHLRSRASECSSWLSRMQIVKDIETEKLKRNRLQAIQQKLACLGYGAELAAMPSINILAKHSLVNQTRPLTDRIWTNIQGELVKYMEKVKVDCLAREHHELLQRRRKVAIDYLRMCKALAPSTLFPPMLDFFELPPIRKIIHLPSNETVTPGHFHQITELIVLHSEAWESSITQRVVDFTLGEDSPLSLEEKCSQAKLAQNVFVCKKCTVFSRSLNRRCRKNKPLCITPLFFPDIMSHRCLSLGFDYCAQDDELRRTATASVQIPRPRPRKT